MIHSRNMRAKVKITAQREEMASNTKKLNSFQPGKIV